MKELGDLRCTQESSSRPSRRPPPPPDEQRRPPRGAVVPTVPTARSTVAQPTPRVTSDRGHRVGVLADPPPGLSAGSLGQHRPGTDRGRPPAQVPTPQAGSRQRQIRLRQTAPPDSRHWAGRAPGPCAGRGARPAPLGPEVDRGGRGLDGEPPLAACDHRRRGPQAVQAEQPGGQCTPVLTHRGPPVLLTSGIRKIGESQVLFRQLLHRRQQHTAPRFMTKSRSICERVPGVNVASGVCELLGC
jgi:hypothetical protein